MGFISLLAMFLLLPFLFLAAILSAFLPFLETILNLVATVAAVFNSLLLIVLLVFRAKWKAAGRMERGYIDSFTGWKRYALLAVKALLIAGLIWSSLLIVLCVAVLVFQPLQYLPAL